jgi:N-acetylglucosamine kinase-like BadF-type ATPase
MTPRTLVLGVDAGGTHTAVALAGSDAKVLAQAQGPGSALKPGGAEESAVIILETARRAAADAKVSLPAERAVVGAAGAGREPEQAELAAALVAAGVARHVRVMGDAELAVSAAFSGGPGILINAGTGSCAFARDPSGTPRRSGGYGWQLGDDGGGYWMGRRALAAAGRAQDGIGDRTTLPSRIIGALGLQGFDDLIRWAATATPAQVAALAPHVLNAARDGEAAAQSLVREAAGELVELVLVLVRHFPGAAPLPVAVTGGLLRASSPLFDGFRSALGERLPRATLVATTVEPAVGAVQLALEDQGAGSGS